MFVDGMAGHGDRVALVADDGRIFTYRDLAERVEPLAAQMARARRLLLIAAENAPEPIIAWLAALRSRTPAIIAGAEAAATDSRIRSQFQPELMFARAADGQWALTDISTEAVAPLHPDLALLLSTSGSTGSPKMARLSAGAVEANAHSIATALAIHPDQRAITSLPIFYSYGLSVVNSHLMAGATLLVTARSVADPAFWAFARANGVASFAGVPYSYEMLERLHFRDDPPPTLQCLTQAGGRLPPELVERYARWSAAHGIRFHVMYGQTEATARMACLPPEEAARHPDCIGRAIAGGRFELLGENGAPAAPGQPGELVYHGANVMMGYATERADCARGAELDALATGDIAEEVERGLYRIVGRRSRFSKIGGKRIALDDLEALLRGWGSPAIVAGDDACIAVWLTGARPEGEPLERRLAAVLGIVPADIVVLSGEMPLLPSGKIDYRAILAHAVAARATTEQAMKRGSGSPVAAGFALAAGRPDIQPTDTFESIGGDSLAFVRASLALEEVLGDLPDGWERMTVAELDALAQRPADGAPPARWSMVPTEWLLRIFATIMVITHHMDFARGRLLSGGALLLMILSGYSFAAFQRQKIFSGRSFDIIKNYFINIIIPYYIIITVTSFISSNSHARWQSYLLISNFDPVPSGMLTMLWFVEALLHVTLITCAILSFKNIRKMAERHPYEFGALYVIFGIIAYLAVPNIYQFPRIYKLLSTPEYHIAYFAIGWLVFFASTVNKKIFAVIVSGATIAMHYGVNSSYIYISMVGIIAITFFPKISLPKTVSRMVGNLATSTYFTYLLHMLVLRLVHQKLGVDQTVVVVIVSFAAGLAANWAWGHLLLAVRSTWGRGRRQWTLRFAPRG
jgi:acyl-coenzyme A synthetase/AMP-(fatty) acid ligase